MRSTTVHSTQMFVWNFKLNKADLICIFENPKVMFNEAIYVFCLLQNNINQPFFNQCPLSILLSRCILILSFRQFSCPFAHSNVVMTAKTNIGSVFVIDNACDWQCDTHGCEQYFAKSPFSLILSVSPNGAPYINTMHFVKVFFISVLMCTFATSITIISVSNDTSENDISMENSSSTIKGSNILETVYARQSVGKSHRFFFTVGERKDGNYSIQ